MRSGVVSMGKTYKADLYLGFNQNLGSSSRPKDKVVGDNSSGTESHADDRIGKPNRMEAFTAGKSSLEPEPTSIPKFSTSPLLCNSGKRSDLEVVLGFVVITSSDCGFIGALLDLDSLSGVPSGLSSADSEHPMVGPPKLLRSEGSSSRPLSGGDSVRPGKR